MQLSPDVKDWEAALMPVSRYRVSNFKVSDIHLEIFTLDIAVRDSIFRYVDNERGIMATKYNPEKDYAAFLELAKEQDELEGRIAELMEERRKLQERIDKHLEAGRQALTFDIIKTAAHEYQVEMLNEITRAVIESNDLEKAVKLIDHLETHLEARLRLKPDRPSAEGPPSVSPAIAAKREASGPPSKTVTVQKPAKSTEAKAPEVEKPGTVDAGPKPAGGPEQAPPPPPKTTKGGRIVERRTVMNEKLHEICRYEYEGDRLARMLFLDSRGNPLRTHQLIYDKDGTLIQEIHIDRAGVTLQVCNREISKEGKITKETVTNAHNEVLHTVEFKYDRHLRLMKKIWKDSNGKKTKTWEYKYEKKDDKAPSKIIWKDEKNKPYVFVDLRYDDKGHILAETSRDRSGDIIRSQNYQYFYG